MLSIFDISYFRVFILKSPSYSFNPLRKVRTKRRDVFMSQDEETASRLVSHFLRSKIYQQRLSDHQKNQFVWTEKKNTKGQYYFEAGKGRSKMEKIENACKWRLWKLKLCFSRWTDCDVTLSEDDSKRNTRPTSFIL